MTAGEDDDWSRRRTLERPPLDVNEERQVNTDDTKTPWRRQREDVNTVMKHWVKYSDESAGPTVYRELTDDVDDEYFDKDVNLLEDSPPISSDSSIRTYRTYFLFETYVRILTYVSSYVRPTPSFFVVICIVIVIINYHCSAL